MCICVVITKNQFENQTINCEHPSNIEKALQKTIITSTLLSFKRLQNTLTNRKSKLSDLIAARKKSPRAGQVSSRRGETCFAKKTERTKKRLYRLQLFYKRGTRRTKFLVINYFQIYSARLHGRRSMRAVA